MSKTQGQLTTFIIPESKNKSINISNVIKKYLYHWPLYLIAIVLFFSLAALYIYKTAPTYDIKASILLKDDKKNQDKQVSALHEIDLVNSAKLVENEIEVLDSRKLIAQVVTDLNLWVNYKKNDGLKTIEFYNDEPVKFTLLKKYSNLDKKYLEIIVIDKNTYKVLVSKGNYKRHIFNKTYKNKIGTWMLESTPQANKYKNSKIIISLSEIETSAILYQKKVDVSLSNKLSSAVVLSISDNIPQRGKDILNRLIINYNLSSTNDKNKDIKNTIAFLDQKIAELSGDLGASEKGLENFKSSKGLTDISLQSKVSLENFQANDNKLNDVNIQLEIINRIDNYVNSSQNSEKVPSANGITDDGLANLIDKLSKLQLDYQELAANTPETSPDFEPVNRQIKITKAAIKESVRNIKLSLQGKRDKLQAYNSNFETSIRSIPAQERQYISIKREQASKESLYTYYLQKREEAAANYTATLTDDKVIDYPYAGFPKDPKNFAFAFAFLLSIGLPTSVIFLKGALSGKIVTSEDITDELNIPIIAELPLEVSKNGIAVNDKFSTPTSEQFRALRTRLHYIHKEKQKGRVTLITSSIPNEGKSFVSTNLCISLAFTERKTIILELDMRKPKIMQTLNLSLENPGLSDYFMGNATIGSIIQNSGIAANLDVIGSGSEISNPTELLERKALKELISHLRETYDDIIIDSPPVHLVPDATIVSPLTDVCLYVVRQGFTSKSELIYLNNLLVQNQLLNLNIVFNGLEKSKYGYGYNYNNSYYTQSKKSIFSSIFSNFSSRF